MFDTSKLENQSSPTKQVNDTMKAVDRMEKKTDKNAQAATSTLKEDVANSVGSMLPQGAGYDTTVLNKNGVISEDSDKDPSEQELLKTCDTLFDDYKFESCIYNFIVTESSTYDLYMEASILTMLKNKFKKPDVSTLAQLYVKSQVLMCKKQYIEATLSSEIKNREMRELNKECIDAEKEFRKAFRKASKETQDEFNKDKPRLNKLIKTEFNAVKEKMGVKTSNKTKNTNTKKDTKIVKEDAFMNSLESYDWRNDWDSEVNDIEAFNESKLLDKIFGKEHMPELKHYVDPNTNKAINIYKKLIKLCKKSSDKLDQKIKPEMFKDKESKDGFTKYKFIQFKVTHYYDLVAEALKVTAQTKKLVEHYGALKNFRGQDNDVINSFIKKVDSIRSKKTLYINLSSAIKYLSSDYDKYEKILIRELNDLIKLAKKCKFKSSDYEAYLDSDKNAPKIDRLYDTEIQRFLTKSYSCIAGVLMELQRIHEQIVNKALQIEEGTATFESSDEYMEAANIGEKMRPIISLLNTKGYRTKYSSPGYYKERRKEDRNKDGVYNGKLYTTARIMFEEPYKFPEAPKYWKFRQVDGVDYLDVEEKWFNPENEADPDKAWSEWQDKYLDSMMKWVEALDYKTDSDNGKNDKNDIDDDESINTRHHTDEKSRADVAEDKKENNKSESKKDDDTNNEDVKESIFNELDSLMDDLFIENDLY